MGNKYKKHNKSSKKKNKGVAFSGEKLYKSSKTEGAEIWYYQGAEDCSGHYKKNNCKCD